MTLPRSPLATALPLALSLAAACSPPVTPPADSQPVDAVSDAPADALLPDAPAPMPRDVSPSAAPTSRALPGSVRREAFFVRAPAPPANAARMTPTPDALNRVQVLRYRPDTTPATEVRAVVIAMPGFLGGAGSIDGLARAIVARGASPGGTPVEVWTVDRRANQLEDLRGMEAAESLSDPEVARDYYLARSITVHGERFAGFLDARDASIAYLSEWGLATTINDLRAVVQQVPDSRTHVVVLGHSLGASIVEAYAAWDFDGTPGYQTIAGLALVDGVLTGAPTAERAYYDGGGPAPGGLGTAPGVTAVRASGPYFFALPVLGIRALAVSEIVARRAIAAPEAIVRDNFRDQLFTSLLGISPIPPMTNAAAMGFGFDNASCGLTIAAMSIGAPMGGPLMERPGPLGGTITVPASGTETYRWVDAPASSPHEFTPLRAAAEAWAATPSNFSEWYFPMRLALDVGALGDLRLDRAGYAFREGIRAVHGGSVDVPVLAVGTEVVGSASSFGAVRARLSATVGEGRPAAGATRDDERAFRVLMVPAMTHIDPVVAPAGSDPANPIPEAVGEFARANGGTPVRVTAM